MKKYENPEILVTSFGFESDVLTVSYTDFDRAEVSSGKDDTTAPF